MFFVIDNEAESYALVQSCDDNDHDNDMCLFHCWSKEFHYKGPNAEPILQVIPVDIFRCQILVIEDDASIVNSL